MSESLLGMPRKGKAMTACMKRLLRSLPVAPIRTASLPVSDAGTP